MIKPFQAYFSITANQINELYNYLTDDGNKIIRFSDFQDLVHFLEENKREEDQKLVEVNVTQLQYDFIHCNLDELSRIRDIKEFKTFIEEEGCKVGLMIDEWNDVLITNLFNMTMDYFSQKNDHEEFLGYLNLLEERKSVNEFYRRTSVNIEHQADKSIENINGYLNVVIKQIESVKAKESSEGVFEILKHFLKLSDQISSEVS